MFVRCITFALSLFGILLKSSSVKGSALQLYLPLDNNLCNITFILVIRGRTVPLADLFSYFFILFLFCVCVWRRRGGRGEEAVHEDLTEASLVHISFPFDGTPRQDAMKGTGSNGALP